MFITKHIAMKSFIQILVITLCVAASVSCKKIIEVQPQANIGAENFYNNFNEANVALTGCYYGLQKSLDNEWMMTELRSDNAKQGAPTSTNATNLELNKINMYAANPTQPFIYTYWLNTYTNINSINYVLASLGVEYNNGAITLTANPRAKMEDAQRKSLAGQALFLRAYHYFNLVRLWGGVQIVAKIYLPEELKKLNRASVNDCYTFIAADLKAAADWLPATPYSKIVSDDLGRATQWAAKSLLAKLYLTTGNKADALTLLNDVINNSGYGLETTYGSVFSITNEMNKEILFAIRFKAGGLGLGSPLGNYFAPVSSGSAVILGDGSGYNFPTTSIYNGYKTLVSGAVDGRKAVAVDQYTSSKQYVKKFTSPVKIKFDGENDFPVIRFADVLLMKAEATGFDGENGSSVTIINQIRKRAGAANYATGVSFVTGFYLYPTTASDPNAVSSQDEFLNALLDERRYEFAFENQRLFDLQRTGKFAEVMKNYFASEYSSHYSKYKPALTLAELQANVDKRPLLPIPQREIDTNNEIAIQQNSGY